MKRAHFIPLAPVLLGIFFLNWVIITRDTWAQNEGTVQVVVLVELILLLTGLLAVLCQLPLFFYALRKKRNWLAGATALGIIGWVVLFLIGMRLGPALTWVT